MKGAIREFLELEKGEIGSMTTEQLAMEVEGWRAVIGTLPLNVSQWLARLHEECRFVLRNNQGHAGILVNARFEAVEYTIMERALTFDSLSGHQMVETKEVTVPASGVSYYEFIEDASPFDRAAADAELAAEKILG